MAVLLALLCHPVPAVLAGQLPGVTATSAQTPASQDPEAQGDRAAPVLIGGEPVIWVTVGAGHIRRSFGPIGSASDCTRPSAIAPFAIPRSR